MPTRNITLLALTLFLAGCVSHQSYPTGWAQLAQVSTDGCPQVIGTFLNQGESRGEFGTTKLTFELFSRSTSRYRADRVSIQFRNANTLSIRALLGDSALDELTLSREKKEFSCKEGFLVIQGLSDFHKEGGFGISYETVFLARSEDGFLMVKGVSSGIGFLLFIPAAGSTSSWTRYPPAK